MFLMGESTIDLPQSTIAYMIDVQQLCETGSEQLIRMDYLNAIATLEEAERIALANRDWDLLSRLYMPLQEARRQVRQKCGKGTVQLDLLATSRADQPDPNLIARLIPAGQVLVAGWASIQPAVSLRRLAQSKKMYLETFLAAVYAIGSGFAIAIVPTADVKMPDPSPRSIDRLISLLPPHSIILTQRELPAGARVGNPQTYAYTMNLWERLHAPFLAAADMQVDPIQKIHAYRATIAVDSACEFAHQRLAKTAHELAKKS